MKVTLEIETDEKGNVKIAKATPTAAGERASERPEPVYSSSKELLKVLPALSAPVAIAAIAAVAVGSIAWMYRPEVQPLPAPVVVPVAHASNDEDARWEAYYTQLNHCYTGLRNEYDQFRRGIRARPHAPCQVHVPE